MFPLRISRNSEGSQDLLQEILCGRALLAHKTQHAEARAGECAALLQLPLADCAYRYQRRLLFMRMIMHISMQPQAHTRISRARAGSLEPEAREVTRLALTSDFRVHSLVQYEYNHIRIQSSCALSLRFVLLMHVSA